MAGLPGRINRGHVGPWHGYDWRFGNDGNRLLWLDDRRQNHSKGDWWYCGRG